MSLDRKHLNYLIRIHESGPQIIDMKKSFFILDNRNNTSRSPRRDKMSHSHNTPETKRNTSSNNMDKKSKQEEEQEQEINKLKEKFDKKITENIRSRKGFEELMKDPEIQIFINEN